MEREEDRQPGLSGTDAAPSRGNPLPHYSEPSSRGLPSSSVTDIDNQSPSLGVVFGRSGSPLPTFEPLLPTQGYLGFSLDCSESCDTDE
jgi:hypothetical protein